MYVGGVGSFGKLTGFVPKLICPDIVSLVLPSGVTVGFASYLSGFESTWKFR